MPEGTTVRSKYALKRQGRVVSSGNTKQRRVCDSCGRSLAGRRGHGFVSHNGRRILCGLCGAGVNFRA